jgi:hypothetical protein
MSYEEIFSKAKNWCRRNFPLYLCDELNQLMRWDLVSLVKSGGEEMLGRWVDISGWKVKYDPKKFEKESWIEERYKKVIGIRDAESIFVHEIVEIPFRQYLASRFGLEFKQIQLVGFCSTDPLFLQLGPRIRVDELKRATKTFYKTLNPMLALEEFI